MRGDEKPRCASGVQDSECRVWPRQRPREGSVSKGRSPGVNAPVTRLPGDLAPLVTLRAVFTLGRAGQSEAERPELGP